MSIGLLPFSNVGYNVSQSYSETSTSPAYTKQLLGDGGLHQLYVGLGVKVLNNLSIGANVSYFGEISHGHWVWFILLTRIFTDRRCRIRM